MFPSLQYTLKIMSYFCNYDKKIFGCTVKNDLTSISFLLKNESNEDVVTRTSLDFLIFKNVF